MSDARQECIVLRTPSEAAMDRIAIKGIGDPRVARILTSGALDAAEILTPQYNDILMRVRGPEYALEQAFRSFAAFDGLTAAQVQIQQALDFQSKMSGLDSTGFYDSAAMIKSTISQMQGPYNDALTSWHDAIGGTARHAVEGAMRTALDYQQTLFAGWSAASAASKAYSDILSWIPDTLAQTSARYAAEFDALLDRFRVPSITVNPIAEDILTIFGNRGSKKERNQALARVTLWLIRERLERHTLRRILRNLDRHTLRAAVLLAITSDEFGRLTPREGMRRMPELVRARIGERPAVTSPKNRPTYKVKLRKIPHTSEQMRQPALDALVAAETVADLEREIRAVNLTAGEEAIIAMCMEGLDVREIAKRRKITVNGVRMQRMRASEKIERYLKRHGYRLPIRESRRPA